MWMVWLTFSPLGGYRFTKGDVMKSGTHVGGIGDDKR